MTTQTGFFWREEYIIQKTSHYTSYSHKKDLRLLWVRPTPLASVGRFMDLAYGNEQVSYCATLTAGKNHTNDSKE